MDDIPDDKGKLYWSSRAIPVAIAIIVLFMGGIIGFGIYRDMVITPPEDMVSPPAIDMDTVWVLTQEHIVYQKNLSGSVRYVDVDYIYDADGQLVSSSATGMRSYTSTYDCTGGLVTSEHIDYLGSSPELPYSFYTTYTYDDKGDCTESDSTMTLTTSSTVYSYSSPHILTKAVTTKATRGDASGSLSAASHTMIMSLFEYTVDGRLSKETSSVSGSDEVTEAGFSYDSNGNPQSVTYNSASSIAYETYTWEQINVPSGTAVFNGMNIVWGIGQRG